MQIKLELRLEKAYDIYRSHSSSLSYDPDTFFVTLRGRTVASGFTSIREAEDYVKEVSE